LRTVVDPSKITIETFAKKQLFLVKRERKIQVVNSATSRSLGARVNHYLIVLFALIVGFVLVYAVFIVPSDRITLPVVTLLTALIWPYLLLLIIVLFRLQVEDLLSVISDRIKAGADFIVGPISVLRIGGPRETKALAERIPTPINMQQVTLENIALLHTSFFSENKTREFNDGLKYYQFEVIVIAPELVMDRIDSVTYHLEDSWPEEFRTREVTDRSSRFKMKDLANGTSIVRADVRFLEQEELLQLNRFIDLRPDGPKI
jgi:hypothetical protein